MTVAAKHIAVLMGGLSAEREVSLVSGRACADALERLGHKVERLDAGRDLAQMLASEKYDLAFNALHGQWGEDGTVQGVLETLELPYTHSGVLASALAMDKARARMIFAQCGLPIAKGQMASRADVIAGRVMEPPFVVKPNAEGSSVGVLIVRPGDNGALAELESDAWAFGDEVLIEQFVPGRELSVAVLDGRPLGVVEIIPNTDWYDFEAKYSDGGSTHEIPAKVPAEIYEHAMQIAARAHLVLGCRGVSRADIRFDEKGELSGGKPGLYLLEVNTQPGMTPTSLVPEVAAHAGQSFDDLIAWMVEDASCAR